MSDRNAALQGVYIPVAAAMFALCIQWVIPDSVIFFTIPLFLLYFFKGYKVYIFGILLLIGGQIILCCLQIFIFSDGVIWQNRLYLFFFQICLIVPLLWLDLRIFPRLRLRYRFALVGLTAVVTLAPVAYFSGIGTKLIGELQFVINDFMGKLSELNTNMSIQENIDWLLTYVITMFVNCIWLNFIFLYAFSWRICAFFVSFRITSLREDFRLVNYYNDRWIILPFAVGIISVIAGVVLDNSIISIIGWNVGLCAGFFLLLQGLGIVQFFLYFIFRGAVSRILGSALLVMSALYFTRVVVLFLITIAVVEFWIPIRRRFNPTDPTPGYGG